jgi:hypothetical protein
MESHLAKKKAPTTLCTYCGKPARPVTFDDPIPKALWKGTMKGRAPKAQSCKKCNNHSNESLLKYFFTALNSDFHDETIAHFNDPRGKKDFRTFKSLWREVNGTLYLFADRKVTAKLRKMFRGLRRYILKKSWFYLPASNFIVFQVNKQGKHYETRLLPLRVKGPNPAVPIHPRFYAMLEEPFQYSFGDFHYELFANDADGMMMALKYVHDEFAHLGNRFFLLCYVPAPDLANESE